MSLLLVTPSLRSTSRGIPQVPCPHCITQQFPALTEPLLSSLRITTTAGTFAVAWFMTKFTEPVRLLTTVAIVPPIAKYWRRLTAERLEDERQELEEAAAKREAGSDKKNL
jgi:hypothetical protein